MSNLSLRLPDSLHKGARELAKKEGISINQLVACALGEKLAALAAEEHLEQRAARGDRAKFESALAKVKAREPDEQDQL